MLLASTHLCLHSFFFCPSVLHLCISAKDEKGQEEADGGSRRFRARMRQRLGTAVRSGNVGVLRCRCRRLYSVTRFSTTITAVPCSARPSPPSQAVLSQGGFSEDEGVRASTLTEANVASVLHHILKEQHEGLEQPANKRLGTNLAILVLCFLPEVKQMVYSLIVKPHICISLTATSSRQQNASIPLRLPAQLLLSGQWKWLGPPVQQQQLPARPWRLLGGGGGGAGPAVPLLPVSAGSLEPHLPGEPELTPPSTTGLVLFNTDVKHQKQD